MEAPCPSCGVTIAFGQKHLGRLARCKQCGAELSIGEDGQLRAVGASPGAAEKPHPEQRKSLWPYALAGAVGAAPCLLLGVLLGLYLSGTTDGSTDSISTIRALAEEALHRANAAAQQAESLKRSLQEGGARPLPKTITAERLILNDATGRKRIELSAIPHAATPKSHDCGLTIHDPTGKRRVGLTVSDFGSSELAMLDGDGNSMASILCLADQGIRCASLILGGNDCVRLGTLRPGHGFVTFGYKQVGDTHVGIRLYTTPELGPALSLGDGTSTASLLAGVTSGVRLRLDRRDKYIVSLGVDKTDHRYLHMKDSAGSLSSTLFAMPNGGAALCLGDISKPPSIALTVNPEPAPGHDNAFMSLRAEKGRNVVVTGSRTPAVQVVPDAARPHAPD